MTRYGSADPFYRALEEREARDRVERLCAADAERFRRQMLAWPLPTAIVDHDPGDEDRSAR